MDFNSGKLFHVGINYVLAPVSEISRQMIPKLHESLMKAGIEIDTTKFDGNKIMAVRDNLPLNVQVAALGPQVAQLLVVAPNPRRAFQVVVEEFDSVVGAFWEVWPRPNLQIIKCDATIRYLYDSSRDDAFVELWQDRLSQSRPALDGVFERPVLGGGLRFVLGPQEGEGEPHRIELKIESFLRETKQVFIDVQFLWTKPRPLTGTHDFRTSEQLSAIDDFILRQVHRFWQE